MLPISAQEEKAIQRFKKRVLDLLGNKVIRFQLFGSRARGEGNEESDIDILILLKEASTQIRGQIFEITADILLEFDIDISPLVMDQKKFDDMLRRERLLPREIERDGITL